MKDSTWLILGGVTVAGILLWPQLKKIFGGVEKTADAAGTAVDALGTIASAGASVTKLVADSTQPATLPDGRQVPPFASAVFPPLAFPTLIEQAKTDLSTVGNAIKDAVTVKPTTLPMPTSNTFSNSTFFPAPIASTQAPNTSTNAGPVYTPPATTAAAKNAVSTKQESNFSSLTSGSVYVPPPSTSAVSTPANQLNFSSLTQGAVYVAPPTASSVTVKTPTQQAPAANGYYPGVNAAIAAQYGIKVTYV